MAFGCDFITKGRKVDCLKGMGGVKNIYIALYADYAMVQTAQSLTSIGTLAEVFKWEFTGNTQGLTQTPSISEDNGTIFFTQVLTLNVPTLGAEVQQELDLLFRNRVIIFVEDYNDNILAMGVKNAVRATNGTAVTGLAKGDMSGYTVEFTAEERMMAPFLNSTAKTALVAAVQPLYITEPPVV